MLAIAAKLVFAEGSVPTELVDSIRTAFRTGGEGHDFIIFLIGTAALIGLVALVARMFKRERAPTVVAPPDYLPRALDVLGLAGEERRELQKLAARSGTAQPVSILLSPTNLAAALRQAGVRLDDATRARFDELSRRLFDAPLPELVDIPGAPRS